MYNTKLKSKILEIMQESAEPLNASGLISRLQEYNKTSIYRSLNTLVSKKQISEISGAKSLHYELRKSPHSHFICNICSSITCIENRITDLILPDGFELDNVDMRGRCSGCA